MKMSLRRSRKIAPESPIAMEEGVNSDVERGIGEGCSRESIHDDQTPLVDEYAANSRKSSAEEQQDSSETRPKTGKRFMRYRNSWVGEDCTLGTLRRVHARLNAARARIIEEADEGILVLFFHS